MICTLKRLASGACGLLHLLGATAVPARESPQLRCRAWRHFEGPVLRENTCRCGVEGVGFIAAGKCIPPRFVRPAKKKKCVHEK